MPKPTSPKPKGGIIPLRVPDNMKADISRLAKKSGLSEADIMRLSIERGISGVEKMFTSHEKQAA
jgi:predicted DNA-binding protein